jgi:hypothetical protein
MVTLLLWVAGHSDRPEPQTFETTNQYTRKIAFAAESFATGTPLCRSPLS